jgi:quinolinate synthetase complex, A subunit
VILAHNYTSADVQGVADFVGDSLGLSLEASRTTADIIVFCGVSFMGETAKLLNPKKTVLLPVPEAYCAMASMCNSTQLKDFKRDNPGYAIVGYVNSTAESKAEMDICCTSSNALQVVESLSEKNILFVPDRNLGAYVASRSDKNIKLWNGFCPIHHGITIGQVEPLMTKYPEAMILAHPECRTEVLELADFIGSTESMAEAAKRSDRKEFIILTEIGMKEKLEKLCPEKTFLFPSNAVCTTMKMIDLDSILRTLDTRKGEVILDKDLADLAKRPVEKMVHIPN